MTRDLTRIRDKASSEPKTCFTSVYHYVSDPRYQAHLERFRLAFSAGLPLETLMGKLARALGGRGADRAPAGGGAAGRGGPEAEVSSQE